MSIRDLLLNILIGFGVAGFVIALAIVDSLPLWILLIFAVIAWVAYIILVIRDHSRDIRYPIIRYRSEKKVERRLPKAPQNLVYDQEEDK